MAFDISNLTHTQVNETAVDFAISLCGVHGERYGRMATKNEGLDCVGLIERVATLVGSPISICRDWQSHGGELPLVEIPVHLAEPGDVLVFDMGAGNRAFRRFQLGVLIRGGTTDDRAQFVGVPHAVAPVWLNAGPWKTALIKAYRFGVVTPSQSAEPVVETLETMPVAKLADVFGRAKALADAAESEVETLKKAIKARGLTELVGADFTVSVTEQIQGRADVAALKAHLGDAYSRFEKLVVSNVIRVKAVASARLQRAA